MRDLGKRDQEHRPQTTTGTPPTVSLQIGKIDVNHAINHGGSMTEAARIIQFNLERSAVVSVIRTAVRTGESIVYITEL